MSDLEIILSIFSIFLVIYGLIITTLNFLRNNANLIISPVIMNINISFKGITIVWRTVHVVNSGRRPIVLESVGITLNNGREIDLIRNDQELPKRLEECDTFQTFTIDEKINTDMIKFCWAVDSTGKVWKSKLKPFLMKESATQHISM